MSNQTEKNETKKNKKPYNMKERALAAAGWPVLCVITAPLGLVLLPAWPIWAYICFKDD